MLHGQQASLRARRPDDVEVLHAELYEDVETRSRADNRPWRPVGPAASPYAIPEPFDDAATFSIVHRPDGELVGEALLWGIDRQPEALPDRWR